MSELAAFLHARITEDEITAGDFHGDCAVNGDEGPCDCYYPARVLAECDAKRRIVEAHPSYGDYGETCATCSTEDELSGDQWPCLTLRLLALPYADHPDYRQEWTP